LGQVFWERAWLALGWLVCVGLMAGPARAQTPAPIPPQATAKTGDATKTEPATAAEERARIAEELRKTIQELHAVRAQRRLVLEGHQDRVSQVTQRVEALRKDVELLDQVVTAERQELTKLEGELAVAARDAEHARAWIDLAAQPVLGLAEHTLARIKAGPALARSRREAAMQEARLALEAPDAFRKMEGLQLVLRFLSEEWSLAQSVSLSNQIVSSEEGKRQDHAWLLSLGLVTGVFVSEDGQTLGVWSGDSRQPWKVDLPADAREHVRAMLRMIRSETPPGLTNAPIWLPQGK